MSKCCEGMHVPSQQLPACIQGFSECCMYQLVGGAGQAGCHCALTWCIPCRPLAADAPASPARRAAQRLLSSLHGLLEVTDQTMESQQGQLQAVQAALLQVSRTAPACWGPACFRRSRHCAAGQASCRLASTMKHLTEQPVCVQGQHGVARPASSPAQGGAGRSTRGSNLIRHSSTPRRQSSLQPAGRTPANRQTRRSSSSLTSGL